MNAHSPSLSAVQHIALPPLANDDDMAAANAEPMALQSNPLHSIRTTLRVSVGSVDLSVRELLDLKNEQVLSLDQAIDAPVDIVLDGHVVARGTLVAVGESFGVRITEVPQPLNLKA